MGDSRRLHIGIDGRELVGRPTGVGRYLAALLRVWAAGAAATHKFTVVLPAAPPVDLVREAPGINWLVDRSDRAGTWWEQTSLARAASRVGVDVFFAAGYTAPLALGCPIVLAVYDVSFCAHPEWFAWREGLRRRWLTRASAWKAQSVISISEFSAAEIVRHLGLPRERIRIALPGAPEGSTTAVMSATSIETATTIETETTTATTTATESATDAAILAPAPRADVRSRVVLFVGSLFNRRRIPELLQGFARAAAAIPEARLVLVGDNRTTPRIDPLALARDLGIEGRVEWRAYVDDAELQALYGSARVFAFLSDYEGFGMTPLEAMARGVPPVLLDTAVGREIYGDSARFVAADPAGIADALSTLLTDDGAHAALVAAGRLRLARYSWSRAADIVLDAIQQACPRR